MAGSAHAFEKFGQSVPSPESEGRVLEVVQSSTPEEILDILGAGADIVVCQDFETRIVEDAIFGGTYADHKNPIRKTYVTAAPEQINKLVSNKDFGGDWEMDTTTYAPYVCLKSRDMENIASVLAKLNAVLGENAKLDVGENYVWNKKQDALEKEMNGGQGKSAAAGAGGK